MLRIITGAFHPDLEQALVEDVRALKAADPFAPLAIIVPSDSLRRRLKWLLCAEHRCALLDVHFLTFHHLAVRLLEETGSFDPSSIRSQFFFKELVHHLLRLRAADFSWSGLADMPGAWGALIATLRDLHDSGVEEDRAGEALNTGPADADQSTQDVLALYRLFTWEKDRLGVFDQDDLAQQATPHVAHSTFLRRQRQILYYGFYDLTQVQLDFFQAIAHAYSTTLYFPLVKGHAAFVFAQRFFDRYMHGLVHQESDVLTLSSDGSQSTRTVGGVFDPSCVSRLTRAEPGSRGPGIRIVSVASRLDEVTVVAKEILGLVEDRGYAFEDIGVVARTLSGYETVIPRVFAEHGIPFSSTVGRSLGEFPLIKAVSQFLDLRATDFRRDQVIGLLSSPFIRLASLCPSLSTPRPDLWDLAARHLGVTAGLAEWKRLTEFLEKDLLLRHEEERELTGPRIPAQQISGLWVAVSCLAEKLGTLPAQAGWRDYADAVGSLWGEVFDVHACEAILPGSDADALAERFREALNALRQLSEMTPQTSFPEFVLAFRRLMEEESVPIGPGGTRGVQVLDAMAARGLPFRALYALGLNEKVFPRHIHEDAFLRDRVRRLLEIDLGFKIQEKLAGYDEEKLLFYLVCNSAREELTLLFQRADEAGRSLVPSTYLTDVQRLPGVGNVAIPRRLTKKLAAAPQYRVERLTLREVSIKLLLARRVPRRLLDDVHPAGAVITQGLTALQAQESSRGLGGHDGITGPLETFWHHLKLRGVSPSALQAYAICPFRYFAAHVLRLDPLLLPENVDQVGALELGLIAHDILRACLETLRSGGHFHRSSGTRIDAMAVLEVVAREKFDRFARSHPVGYPLVWELHQEQLLILLREALGKDLEELEDEWEPVLFEEKLTGSVAVALSDGSKEFAAAGRVDRVDWSPSQHAYRIIDYKYKAGKTPDTLDQNLQLGAVRARRLQPPLYLSMAVAGLPAKLKELSGPAPPTCAGVWFYYLAPNWEPPVLRVPFPGDAWTTDLRDPMAHAIQTVLEGIGAGRFFIAPSGACDHCDYRLLCRKTHEPALWRARHDHPVVRAYRELRKATVPARHAAKGPEPGPVTEDSWRP